MSFLGRIFGTEKGISKAIDGLYNGIDKSTFTKEEQADNLAKILKLYEPFKQIQRIIVATFCPAYVLAWFIIFIKTVLVPELSIAPEMELLNGDMGRMVTIMIVFYFGGGAIEGIVRSKK